MLKEIYQYVSTPVPSYIRQLGLLKESIGLEARFQRCRVEWQPHYVQCQRAITLAVEQTLVKNTIVIIGAGSLRDIPLDLLAEEFNRVILIDLLFLKQVKRRIKRYSNVQLIEMDITNGLKKLLTVSSIEVMSNFLSENPPQLMIEADCIVSLNLITQLPLVPTNFLSKKFNPNAFKIEHLVQLLINQHLVLLNAQKGVKCLIADREICEFDKQGKKVECFNPAWDVELPKVGLNWDWIAVPYRESTSKYQQVHQVGCSIWVE